MPIEFNISEIRSDLLEFRVSLSEIDMGRVKERTLKRVADEMAEMVRQAVVAEDDITSPAMNSKYSRGKGPSMATLDAWQVKETGANRYSVFPHPEVRQRAMVLNYGYPGTIEADDGYLRFEVNGVPMFRKEVEGPDPTGYWQAAMNRMETSDKLNDIASQELEREFEMVFV